MRMPFLQSEDEPQDRLFADEDQIAVSFKVKREYDDEFNQKMWGFHALSETYFLTISSNDALLQYESGTQNEEANFSPIFFIILPITVIYRKIVN